MGVARGAHARGSSRSSCAGFFAGGALLAVDAWQRAWRPSLRDRVRGARARRARARPTPKAGGSPEDDEAFAVVEGTLRADAAPTGERRLAQRGRRHDRLESGRHARHGRPSRPSIDASAVTGGIVVTVVGSLAAERVDEWRAGRRVRLPVELRRPSRYLDPGVPDHERALARRGTTLVGTVKSGALVEVAGARQLRSTRRWRRRAPFARRAIADGVGRWSAQSAAIVAAIVIGDRAGLDEDVQRRLQEAGTYHVIAISGGNIAILAGLLLGGVPARRHGSAGRRCSSSIARARSPTRDFVGGGASVDRATLMAVVYFARARVRSPQSAAQRAGARRGAARRRRSAVGRRSGVSSSPSARRSRFSSSCRLRRRRTRAAEHATIPAGVCGLASSACDAAVDVRRVGGDRGAAVSGRRARLLARHVRRARAELSGDSADGASRRSPGMAVVPLGARVARAAAPSGWVAQLGAAGLVWSADLVRFAPALTYRVAPPSLVAVARLLRAPLTRVVLWRGVGDAVPRRGDRAARRVGRASRSPRRSGSSPTRGRSSRRAATAACTSRFSTSGRATRRSSSFRAARRCSSTPAASSSVVGVRHRRSRRRAGAARRRRSGGSTTLALTHGDPDHIGGAASIVREFRPREVWEGIPVPRFEPLTALRLAAQAAGARWANVYAGDHVVVDGVEVVARHPAPPTGSGRRCATTTRSCSSCAGATCRCC